MVKRPEKRVKFKLTQSYYGYDVGTVIIMYLVEANLLAAHGIGKWFAFTDMQVTHRAQYDHNQLVLTTPYPTHMFKPSQIEEIDSRLEPTLD